MDEVKIIQIILLLVFIGVVYVILRLYRVYKYERRLAPFAISSVKQADKSLMDILEQYFENIISKIARILNKSVVIKNYGLSYNKYISYDQGRVKEGINCVVIKLLVGLLVVFLALISLLFKGIKFRIIEMLLVFIIGFFLPDLVLILNYKRKSKRLEDDLLKAIIIMNNAFSSGRNIIQAIECVKNELDGPIKDEFKKISLDINYGLSLDIVFKRFYERVKIDDAKYVATSLTLLNKTGGDIIKVFKMLEKSIMDKKKIKNELNSLTAASRFVFKLLISLPLIFVLVIIVLNPSYFMPLIASPVGVLIFGIIVGLYLIYIIIIKKLLEVEV